MNTTTKLTPEAVDAHRIYELMAAAEAQPAELEEAVGRLLEGTGDAPCRRPALRWGKPDHGRAKTRPGTYQWDLAGECLRRRKELPDLYENPLDDDERLRQVRIQVFGSAPE